MKVETLGRTKDYPSHIKIIYHNITTTSQIINKWEVDHEEPQYKPHDT